MKDLYTHPDESSSVQIRESFNDNLVSLYAKTLEFQARALCYLYKHSVFRIFRDMFKQDAWDGLLKEIESLDGSAQRFTPLIRDADVKRRLEEIQQSVNEIKTSKATSEREKEMKKFLHKLYTCPYQDRKDRNESRVPGTCNWFTSHDKFCEWEKSDHSSLLWVSADPGCGKSVLAKYLVDEFLPNSKRTRTVCYFFFKDDFSDQKNAANAIAAILRQLFTTQPHLLSNSVMDKLHTDGNKLLESFNDLWSILMQVAANPDACEIVCVFDALDECQDNDRKQFIAAVRVFYSPDLKKQNLKFLITSRPYDHIRRGFHELEARMPKIHLSGESEIEVEKISHEIDLVIEKRVRDIGAPRNLNTDQLESLRKALTSRSGSQRTYLWVSLTLDVIENMTEFTKGEINQVIRHVPQSVNEAYTKILNRSPNHEKAKRILHIITAAKRPLSLGELSIALAFSAGSQYHIEEIYDRIEWNDQQFKTTIRDLCGLLLVVINSKVYFLHQTTKEFLVLNDSAAAAGSRLDGWEHSLIPETSHRVLTESCTLYLVQNITESPLNKFLKYAAHNWASHFRAARIQSDDPIVTERGLALCEPESDIFKTWRNTDPAIPDLNSLMVASYLELVGIVHKLLLIGKTDVNQKDSEGWTPLSVAILNGYNAIVKLLLGTGEVDLNSKDEYGKTALSTAVLHGNEAAVKLLLDTGEVDVNSKNTHGLTPLLLAAENGNKAAVKLLLETGEVDVNSKGCYGLTPLLLAAYNGNKAVVKLLLDTGEVDVNSKNTYGLTPLFLAAENGNKAVVKLLLETGEVDVDSKDEFDQTALSIAACNGHEAVVKLLRAHLISK